MSVTAVYDCMLFLQAASQPNRVRSTFQVVFDGRVTLVLSSDVIAEVRDVLTRPRHAAKFPSLTPQYVNGFLANLLAHSRLVESVPPVYVVQRDPKDSKYVDLAAASQADYLVSWDRHLLDLMDVQQPEGLNFRRRFPNLQISNPPDFLRLVQPHQSI